MKGFLKDNWIILSLIIFTLLSEVGHLPFNNWKFNDKYNWDTPLYYFFAQFGLVNFWPAYLFFELINKQHKSSKCMAFGLVVWNVKELIDELAYMAGINTNVFEINSSFWGQLAFIITVVFFSAYGYSKWKY